MRKVCSTNWKGVLHIAYWWEGGKKGLIGKPSLLWVDNIKDILKERNVAVSTGFNWLRIGTI
jgi:hypothetical protein